MTETLGERIRVRREAEGWSLDDLAKRSGVSKDAIWKIENGQVKSPYSIADIASALGVSVRELRGERSNGKDKHADTIDANARPIRAAIRRVPVYRLLPASHLGGPEDMYTVPHDPDEYRDLPAPSAECMVVQISGTCMEPDWPSGCYVMIDYGRTAGEGLVPRAAYYVQLRGEGEGKATFKRYCGPDGDAEVFDCINKKDYPQKIRITGLFNAGIAVAKVDWMVGKTQTRVTR